MRFEYYHAGLEDVPKLSVDGLVPASVHFSHWQGNQTPARVKADSSTEIALNVVAAPDRDELTQGIELVTNNHFDTDGVLSVWTMLTGERALDLRADLIAAAEAGDFSANTGAQGIRASLVLQGGDEFVPDAGVASPLARHLAGGADVDEARAYALVLPEVERVLTRTNYYEHLWHDEWAKTEASLESFASGASRVEEDAETGLSVVTLSRELYGARGFTPTRNAAPYTAITANARGRIYLIAIPLERGWGYRVDYPYYSWAETVVRPPVSRYDFAPLVARLAELEQNKEGRWQIDTEGLSSAFNFANADAQLRASSLAPERVADELRAALSVVSRPLSVVS
ncbi:MAG TPA: DUF6687 family protein [Pyrinomonadaceae bacterium]|jgi:hypothetical protein|nr:DUF6687 family protein [Pyrinomonadaceae bacterium]